MSADTVLKWCGAAVLGASAAFVLRGRNGEFASAASAICVLLLTGAAITAVAPVFAYISDTSAADAFGGRFTALLKALGIAAAVSATAELCRGVGDNSAAAGVELFGCAQILLLCLPLVTELLGAARTLASM